MVNMIRLKVIKATGFSTITEAAKITYTDGKPMYEVKITKEKESADLLFNSSFKFVKKGHF